MKIIKIELTQEEETQIFNELVKRFDLNDSRIFERGVEVEFELTDEISCVSLLELYNEGYNEPETNAPIITHQSVIKFKLKFYDTEGNEIDVKLNNISGECIEDRISKYYSI